MLFGLVRETPPADNLKPASSSQIEHIEPVSPMAATGEWI
jgi:hypothetical protein